MIIIALVNMRYVFQNFKERIKELGIAELNC